MYKQITIYDILRTSPDMNPPTLTNPSGKVKLNFLATKNVVEVEMVFESYVMVCKVNKEDLKEVVSRL